MSDTLDSNRIRLRTSNLVTGALSLKTSSLNINSGGGGDVGTIDPALSPTSTNAVQNKAICEALDNKANASHTHTTVQITDWNNATSQFLTAHQDISGKQDKLTPGQNITIDENNIISASGGGGSVVVDSTLSTDSVNPVQNKVITTALNAKADTSSVPTKTSDLLNDSGFITSADVPSSTSNFIGTFANINNLPQSASIGNYAYVGTQAPYTVYSYGSNGWVSTGATVDTNNLTADEEDITASEVGVLSLKDRDTTYSSKAYVRVRKNLQTVQVKKTYADNEVTWIHAVESTSRSKYDKDDPTTGNWDASSKYIEGDPFTMGHYGNDIGFPYASTTKQSVRRAVPEVVLNTADNCVYFHWKYYYGKWQSSDIWYSEWSTSDTTVPRPSDKNSSTYFDVEEDKVFAYVTNGITHYYKFSNNSWVLDETVSATINLLDTSVLNQPNTIYEIMYDMDLNGTTWTPAQGVVIKYAGGKIKNGSIDFHNGTVQNPIIIDCPDVQFFENVCIVKHYWQALKDVWFDDIWKSISISAETGYPCIRISLSKNNKITFKHGVFSFADDITRKLRIDGNGYQITLDNTYTPVMQYLFLCRHVEIYDATIEVTNKTLHTYNTIFNVCDVLMRNVNYRGYSRFATNDAVQGYSKSALILYNCDMRSTAFLFESYFNKVRFYDCHLDFIDPHVKLFQELISIGSNVTNTTVEEANVEVYNTYIGGLWELICKVTDSTSCTNYKYMKFHNCELVTFTINNSTKLTGNTDVIYEDCHFKTCNLPWKTSSVSTVTYKNCWFDIFNRTVGNTKAGPFNFWNINSATFEGCTFNKTSFSYHDGNSNHDYGPLSDAAIITIAPPESIVGSGTSNVALTDSWNFKLYLYNNRIMVNDNIKNGVNYRPYSHFYIRTVNPHGGGANNQVTLTDAEAKNMIVSRGNVFVHSISGVSGYFYNSVGCHAYLNSRENVIPVDNTIFSVEPATDASTDLNYALAHFGYCGTDFTFIDASASVPRFGRYNAATNKVAWLTYSAEEDVPTNT